MVVFHVLLCSLTFSIYQPSRSPKLQILGRILQNLHLNADKLSAMLVCKRWFFTIDELVGTQVCIGNKYGEFWDPSNPVERLHSPDIIQRKGVNVCLVSDICTHHVPVSFRTPNLVKELELLGRISLPQLEALLENLNYLTHLGLHLSTLSGLELIDGIKIPKKQLKSISFSSTGFQTMDIQNFPMMPAYNNLCVLLATHFPKLEAFNVKWPVFLDFEVQLAQEMAQFIARHNETLKQVSYSGYKSFSVNVVTHE